MWFYYFSTIWIKDKRCRSGDSDASSEELREGRGKGKYTNNLYVFKYIIKHWSLRRTIKLQCSKWVSQESLTTAKGNFLCEYVYSNSRLIWRVTLPFAPWLGSNTGFPSWRDIKMALHTSVNIKTTTKKSIFYHLKLVTQSYPFLEIYYNLAISSSPAPGWTFATHSMWGFLWRQSGNFRSLKMQLLGCDRCQENRIF